MIKRACVFFLALASAPFQSGGVSCNELRGFVGIEPRLFFNSAIHPGQKDHSFSIVAAPQYYHEFREGSNFSFIPFFRWDGADSERTHFDVRELTFNWVRENWQIRVGARKEFWGVTETQHLVDIVNQTDLVENIDGEDKLGQPMVNLSFAHDWGTFDVFLLPYFRERTFPGRRGRLRPVIRIDTDKAVYESSAKEWHTDFAVRYFHTMGKVDIGLSHFVGTGREPTVRFGIDTAGRPFLFPFYERIYQTGLESLYVIGSWIWKLEAIYRRGQGKKNFFAWTGGFEYTFSGIGGTGVDLGFLSEWSYDTRGKKATTPLQNDLAIGTRLGVNDVEGTEILVALVQDLKSSSRLFFIEASTLLTEHWRASIELRDFFDQPQSDLLFGLRDDDFLQIGLTYHF